MSTLIFTAWPGLHLLTITPVANLPPPSPLPGPGLVPGVATHPAPTPVLVLVPVVTSAVGLAEVGRVIK